MNKTERMYAVVEELRAVSPRPRSAGWLAERFEVSRRTIERDLVALQQAGVPIWADTGRRGGYYVDTKLTLPPLNFTPSEAVAIAVALAIAGPAPLAEASRSGLAKIVAAMSPAARRGAAELIRRILLPDDGSTPAGGPPPVVVDALANSRTLEFDYADRAGAVTRRTVEPIGLLAFQRAWYLVAWCRLRDSRRVFRLDRVDAVTTGHEPAPPRDVTGWDVDVPAGLEPAALAALV